MTICRELYPTEKIFQFADVPSFSYAGRFLDEVGGPLRRIWFRFMCMNAEWEYEQPFYALHPEEFKA